MRSFSLFIKSSELLKSLCRNYVRAGRDHLPLAVFAGASLVFADTAALSLLTLNREALTITVTIMMVSVAVLMPWNWRWQAGLAIAAGASMAGATFIRPEAYAHIRYDWLAIAAAVVLRSTLRGRVSGTGARSRAASRHSMLIIACCSRRSPLEKRSRPPKNGSTINCAKAKPSYARFSRLAPT